MDLSGQGKQALGNQGRLKELGKYYKLETSDENDYSFFLANNPKWISSSSIF
jgi:hypothetical protein